MISYTVDSILSITNLSLSMAEYDGAIPYDSDFIPFNYMKREKINAYIKKWSEMGDVINREMKQYLEINCIENPNRLFVSNDWIPFAEFNNGSHVFALMKNSPFAGTVLGLYEGPYSVIRICESLDKFIVIGKENLTKL